MYETPEQLAKGYTEATQKISQQGQELAQVRAQLDQYEQERAQAAQPDPAEVEQYWSEQTGLDAEQLRAVASLVDQAAAQRMQAWQQQNEPQYAQQTELLNSLLAYAADKTVAGNHSDWNEVKGQVVRAIADDPDLFPEKAYTSPDETAKALERVYRLVKAEAAYEQQQSAEADQGRQQKLAAQTMSGAAGRPDAPSNDEEWWAKVKGAAQQGYAARMAANGQ